MFADLLDLVLPGRCAGCGRAGPALCYDCGTVTPIELAVSGLTVMAAARYEGAIRTALLAYKERGRRELARPLGRLLGHAVQQLLDTGAAGGEGDAGIALVPVPSSSRARRSRGGDHVVPLARAARGPSSEGAQVTRALSLVRAVRDSAGLDIAGRAANLRDAMVAAPPRTGRAAVIVDDITTTGASLAESARALQVQGWTVAGAAVVAATPRRHPRLPRKVRAGYRPPVLSGRSSSSGLT